MDLGEFDNSGAAQARSIEQRVRGAGLRPTRQRLVLGRLLFESGDRHVTAEQLHAEVAALGEHVSLATVYNTLHQFKRAGLVRELAIELAPLVRVNGVAPATVVQGSAMFPRDRVIGSLAKYNIAYSDDEPTESLVTKLAQFYADRTLTKNPITPADQAEAYFLLISQRLSKTTGQVITVDGGLHEAFLR